jgi:predicted kinase
MDNTVYALVGPPAVGKTTWTQNNLPDAAIINRDSIVETVAARYGLTYDEAYTAPPDGAQEGERVKDMEKFGLVVASDLNWRQFDFTLPRSIHREVKDELQSALIHHSKGDKDVILDMTNMVRADRDFYLQHFTEFRKIAVLFDFQEPKTIMAIKERCAARHKKLLLEGRSKSIPDSAIDRMIASYEAPSIHEGFHDIVAHDILTLMLLNPKWNSQ